MLCRDGSYSALIGGRPVWTFGDTCPARGRAAGDTFIDNSLAWGDGLDASDGIALTHTTMPTRTACRSASCR